MPEYSVHATLDFRVTARNEEQAQERAQEITESFVTPANAKWFDVESATIEVETVEEE